MDGKRKQNGPLSMTPWPVTSRRSPLMPRSSKQEQVPNDAELLSKGEKIVSA